MADDVEALRRERDSLARRCANRFEETQAALDVIRWLRAGRKPDLDAGLWWRNDLRVSWPMTDAHRAALRAAADDAAGVAAGPQATPDQVLWEGETSVPAFFPEFDEIDNSEVRTDAVPVPPGTRVRVVAVPTGDQEQP